MDNTLRKNCIYYQIYTYSQKSLLLFYIITLYYLALGLSFTKIALISVIGTVSTLISEVPTGVIADKWSRKKSLQISVILKITSVFFMLLGKNFYFLCLASLIWGISDSCQSGAEQALLFESFDDQEKYDSFLSKTYSRSYIISAIATISATLLFSINIYLPIIISLSFLIVSFLAVTNFIEVRQIESVSSSNFFTFNKEVLLYIKNNKQLLNVLLLMSLCTIIIMFINSYTQPLLIAKGIDIKILGIVMFIYNLLMSFGAKAYSKIKLSNIHYIIAAFLAISSILIGLSNLYICLICFALYRFSNGMIWPSLTYKTNCFLKSEFRSTTMSYQNMFTSILCIFIDPAIGIALDELGIELFYSIFGCIALFLIGILFFSSSNQTS